MKYAKSFSVYLIIFAFLLLVIIAFRIADPQVSVTPYSYSDLLTDLKNDKVEKLEIQKDAEAGNAGTVLVTLKEAGEQPSGSNKTRIVPVVDLEGFSKIVSDMRLMGSSSFGIVNLLPAKTNFWLSLITPFIFLIVVVVVMFFLVQQMQGGGGGSRVMSFGKSKAKVSVDDKKKVTFEHVAGLDEEKAELQEIVEFLKAPKKFVDIGARIPKGVLLVGPPGTGKTLLAKAVAGEAGVPFFSISGSDFVEMFVGVGASRVRDLFEQAKKNCPCIIFIDEIDAVGRRRGAGLGGGHDEREQTLNQLLVEMDGFGVNEGVIIIAATNRPDILDPALLRPGRFDRQVSVGLPDIKGREEILKVHAKGKIFAKGVDLKVVAQTTAGFTGADLENLLNEAALLAARDNKKTIEMEEIRRAFVKVGIGTEKKSRVVSARDKRITAYHEAGHAIIGEVLPELDPVHMVSIIPTGRAAGYTMHLPDSDNSHVTKKYLTQTIVSLLGGRAAEYLVIKDITTGASNDIERATAMARGMVTKYGMSEVLGPIQFGDDNEEVFIGRDLAHSRNYGEQVASVIDSEIRRIVDEAYNEALKLIEEHMDILHAAVKLLIEKEKITGEEFRELFGENLPPKTNERKRSAMDEIPLEDIKTEKTGKTEKEPEIGDKGEDNNA